MLYTVKNVKLKYKNFKGAASRFNAEGKRNFHIVFNSIEDGDYFLNEGFNVKFPVVSENIEEDSTRDTDSYIRMPHMKINLTVNDRFIPEIKMFETYIDEHGEEQVYSKMTLETPEAIAQLDSTYITRCSLKFRDYRYDEKNATAYLSKLYVWCPIDDFMEEYGF